MTATEIEQRLAELRERYLAAKRAGDALLVAHLLAQRDALRSELDRRVTLAFVH